MISVRRGNLGFGALSSGPISARNRLPPEVVPPDEPGDLRAGQLGVLDWRTGESGDQPPLAAGETAALSWRTGEDGGQPRMGAGQTDALAWRTGESGGQPRMAAGQIAAIAWRQTASGNSAMAAGQIALVVWRQVPPPVPGTAGRAARVPVGMAEYTSIVGTGAYLVRGAIPGFATLRSQLHDKERVGYRTTDGIIYEVGQGIFDWRANELIRVRVIIPDALVDWAEGRKLVHIIEDGRFAANASIIVPTTGLSIGIGEYTTTTGTGAFDLRGPMPEFASLRSTLADRAKVQYRATDGGTQEFGEGIFDSVNNQVIRNVPIAPDSLVDWGPGRKLIYITEI